MVTVLRPKLERRVRKALGDAARRDPGADERYHTDIDIVPIEADGYRFVLHSQPGATRRAPEPNEAVLRAMPRRPESAVESAADFDTGPPPLRRGGIREASLLETLARLVVWIRVLAYFALGTLWSSIRRRDTEERRAVRLRQMFESAGGTFVKIGQQMSIRLDLLPARYCHELSKMLDHVPPFAVEQAIQAVERSTGQSLAATFSQFDPQPIGSASVACVYQAVLRDSGQRVAVKVRRPHIERVFAADFRVIDWLLGAAELLTIVRPGFTANFRRDLRNILAGELDFRREARLQEIFGRRAQRVPGQFFTAPRVFFEWSGEDVIVQQFSTGMWLFELLAAVEQHDPLAIARMRELNIDPKLVARRLMYAGFWGLYDNVAFHADPHPANVVVQADSKLVFIDFGACGYLDQARKLSFQRTYAAMARGDLLAMTQVSLAVTEPLPPIDVNLVVHEMEAAYHQFQLALKSKHAAWYERTSAALWMATIGIIRKHGIPAPVDLLIYARATLLYDTICARLDPSFNYPREYRRYGADATRKASRRVKRAIRRRLDRGLTNSDYAGLEAVAATANEGLYRLRRLFTAPHDFLELPYAIEKGVYTFMTILKFGVRWLLLTGALTIASLAVHAISGESIDPSTALQGVLSNRWYQIAVLVLGAIHVRLILFRMADKTRTL
jgi:predicted unusual protein kinase regulating ubiquinone biosynthesis (AarF/ABC1/UbiB family)